MPQKKDADEGKEPARDGAASAAKHPVAPESTDATAAQPAKKEEKPWFREKVAGPLDFPKSGIGIQCDINFDNPLGIYNTQMLRCYSLCDDRVRPMMLFVKAWAKARKINSSYSGTLSSYGYVLMVLHYLVNVAQPCVCPNLQLPWRLPVDLPWQKEGLLNMTINGWAVHFYHHEERLGRLPRIGGIAGNTQPLGALLRGFFRYYASLNARSHPERSFVWMRDVLALRTSDGILSKEHKEWTGARTTIVGGKEVRQRYLFAIEDPFELDHNVARTVTHHGIVAIRDEFRRAARILEALGRGMRPKGGLMDEIEEPAFQPHKPAAEGTKQSEQSGGAPGAVRSKDGAGAPSKTGAPK